MFADVCAGILRRLREGRHVAEQEVCPSLLGRTDGGSRHAISPQLRRRWTSGKREAAHVVSASVLRLLVVMVAHAKLLVDEYCHSLGRPDFSCKAMGLCSLGE